MKNGLILHTLK